MKYIFKSSLLVTCLMFFGQIFGQTTQRKPLYEIYTSSTCGPCAPGNENFQNVFHDVNYDKGSYIKYQVNWPGTGDPYFHNEVGSRRNYYSVSAVPHLMIDGDEGPFITDLVQADIDAAYAVPSIVKLEVAFQIDEPSQTVDVQVRITALQDLISGIYLYVGIFEHETFNNVKSNGETEFFHVMKKMVPNSAGTYIGSGWVAGQTEDFTFSYTFNGPYILPPDANSPVDYSTNHTVEEFSDLGVVAWLQKSSTKEVFQSAYGGIGTLDIVEENKNEISTAKIYPNPSDEQASIAFQMTASSDVQIDIFDIMGNLVYSTSLANVPAERTVVDIDTKDYANGLYLVKISSDFGEISRKMTIQR